MTNEPRGFAEGVQSSGSEDIKVRLSHNQGSGFSDWIEVKPGTTVGALFGEYMEGADSRDYRISVRRETLNATSGTLERVKLQQPISRDLALQERDEIVFSAVNIKGA